ncbi:alpha/beta hydrolase [Lentzea fradiae]|uniref:alpha/beta hydrolase n=1 Tax=Lentzea fradiae TaxID=200378 RepID=UPI001C4092B8|nr:alpha/beta hydrolase [Lentzea fradiae]
MAALLLAVAAATAVPVAASQSGGVREFYEQQPRWSPCDFDAEVSCASIEVPLDYGNPGGRRISVAVSRQPATDPAARRGVLFSNPGGPGGSGLVTVNSGGATVSWPKDRFASTSLSRHYDLVGFDPRGVGRSTPLACEEPAVERPLTSRPSEADFAAVAEWARRSQAGCEQVSGDLVPHINTRDTARDMDVLRGVLGEEKISYVGYSYGTYLGAVYGTLFPEHLDRSVLDSAVPGDMDWRRTQMAGAVAARRNVEQWAAWTAGRYDLGTTRDEVLTVVAAVSGALPETPERFGSQRSRFDREVGYLATLRPDWDDLAELVRETRETGTFPSPVPPGEPVSGVVTGYVPVNQTVHCETEWPADLDVYRRDTARFSEEYPYGAGAATAMPDPCTFRTGPPKERATEPRRHGYLAGLVVQAEGDVQTEYSGGVEMARKLGHRLVTVADDGDHGQYARRGNTCVDDAVTRYLVDGTLPAADLTCPGKPRPDVP